MTVDMDRQTLRDWVHRYNAEGLAGLISRVGVGPAPLLNEAQMAELLALVVNGPDPEVDRVVRWRCVDLREQVARRFSVDTTERTIGRWPVSYTHLDVYKRQGHHCAQPLMERLGLPATARASFGIYSDEADVDALIRAVRAAQKIFGD